MRGTQRFAKALVLAIDGLWRQVAALAQSVRALATGQWTAAVQVRIYPSDIFFHQSCAIIAPYIIAQKRLQSCAHMGVLI